MREIKFRVWIDENEKEKGMYNVAAIHFDDDATYVQPWGKKWQTPNGILLMSTGLYDRNGKRIYEGDILQDDDYLYLVEYDNGFNQHTIYDVWLKKNVFDRNNTTWLSQIYCDKYEIIGNIYENPELLKKELKLPKEILDYIIN